MQNYSCSLDQAGDRLDRQFNVRKKQHIKQVENMKLSFYMPK
jgi:hypothetical protein